MPNKPLLSKLENPSYEYRIVFGETMADFVNNMDRASLDGFDLAGDIIYTPQHGVNGNNDQRRYQILMRRSCECM